MSNNRSYFMRRAAQERSAAATASGDKAREAHREMSRLYWRRAKTGDQPASEPAANG
jgi:hypothetical protein